MTQRPSWLDPSISFCGDTPDCKKAIAPVLLDIHCRDSKVWNWGVEIDFICRACPSCGAWAQIDHIAECCGGKRLKCAGSNGPGMRGCWFQFNFKTANRAFRFAQQSLLFVRAMEAAEVGLISRGMNDPLHNLYMDAQQAAKDSQAL